MGGTGGPGDSDGGGFGSFSISSNDSYGWDSGFAASDPFSGVNAPAANVSSVGLDGGNDIYSGLLGPLGSIYSPAMPAPAQAYNPADMDPVSTEAMNAMLPDGIGSNLGAINAPTSTIDDVDWSAYTDPSHTTLGGILGAAIGGFFGFPTQGYKAGSIVPEKFNELSARYTLSQPDEPFPVGGAHGYPSDYRSPDDLALDEFNSGISNPLSVALGGGEGSNSGFFDPFGGGYDGGGGDNYAGAGITSFSGDLTGAGSNLGDMKLSDVDSGGSFGGMSGSSTVTPSQISTGAGSSIIPGLMAESPSMRRIMARIKAAMEERGSREKLSSLTGVSI